MTSLGINDLNKMTKFNLVNFIHDINQGKFPIYLLYCIVSLESFTKVIDDNMR